ncbi:dynein heavy chain 17, axonemal isoform X1 [Fundulus heteroclitus]|uniref:dynein heavy chain 17, axonemal isoform X1 n=2 Tax=Fundulus heteroclitus TaxID=8078 RepID=UPI00165B9120|nr:dynein heavy chain 17, axonemal isoform X1 [Fundulus heteroclitus]
MEVTEDQRLEPIRTFIHSSFRLDPDKWREFVAEKSNMAAVSRFINGPDAVQLFHQLQPPSGLCASLSVPPGVRTKVLCVSKSVPEALPKENPGKVLRMQEFLGGEALRTLVSLHDEVSRWTAGLAQDALKLTERQRSTALVMKALEEGHTFLPPPDALRHLDNPVELSQGGGHHGNNGSSNHEPLQEDSSDSPRLLSSTSYHDDAPNSCSSLRDNVDQKERKLSVAQLLHACEETVVEWVELVGDLLQQDWSGVVLDRLKPVPSEEFAFWKERLRNLLFIQSQLMSPEAQQVASILQAADSVYWVALQDLQDDVQEAVCEAEDIVENLTPVEQKLSEVLEMNFCQLKDNMAAVMEEVRLLWMRSKFYCWPARMMVLLQEICNLFVHLSRKFLPGPGVIRVLESEPGPVLDDVRLVIQTLQALKSAYTQKQTQLELQNQATPTRHWTFPSTLVFSQLDTFLRRLLSIQEAQRVAARFYRLGRTVLFGLNSTTAVQQVSEEFLVQVRLLSGCSCDPTDPEDQNFELKLDRFQAELSHLETRLVSVLSTALGDCSEASSAAKIVQMFWFFVDQRAVRDQLHPHLNRLADHVLTDLDQTESEFYNEKERPERFFRFHPTAVARLCWNRQLRRRAEAALRSFGTIQNLCGGLAVSRVVLEKWRQIVDLLEDFRTGVRSDWSAGLESDCDEILKHSLIQISPPAHLEVACRYQLEAVLLELRYVSREGGVELRPQTAHFLERRDDITHTYLRLRQMVLCYNQVVGGAMEAELPLIQDKLQELQRHLSELKRRTWTCEGVQQQSQPVVMVHFNIREARANMDAMRRIAQGWAELELLQRSGSLLESGVNDQTCRLLKTDGEQLLGLTQVNRSLYGADESSPSWRTYLDYVDDNVLEGLQQLLRRALRYLADNMSPQSRGHALLAVTLRLQQSGSAFEPEIDAGLTDFLKGVISEVYAAAGLVPRISVSRHANYQASLQQDPELCALEQEVMCRLLQVKEEAEQLRAGLDRYCHLWQRDRRAVFQEFLTYGKLLGTHEAEAERSPPTLKDYQREIQVLLRFSSEVTGLDEVIVLHGWLQVDLRPFTTRLLSIILDWKHMYTDLLLESATKSLQQVTRPGSDEEESSSSSTFPLTDTILLLEAAGVELPEHLAAQLQVVTSR